MTTASITASATSAILSGPRPCACAASGNAMRRRRDQRERGSAECGEVSEGAGHGRRSSRKGQGIRATVPPRSGVDARASWPHLYDGRYLAARNGAETAACSRAIATRRTSTPARTTPARRRGPPRRSRRRAAAPSAVSSTCAIAFFAADGTDGEDQPLDHEHEAERDDEIRHAGTTGAAARARRARRRSCSADDYAPISSRPRAACRSDRRNSGRSRCPACSTMRVSLWRSPDS